MIATGYEDILAKRPRKTLAREEGRCRRSRESEQDETARRILELTEDLKRTALALAKPSEDRIRVRAQEIWEEWPTLEER